jgi:transposase
LFSSFQLAADESHRSLARRSSVATRYDQLASSFLGMVHLATARYWLKFVHAA